MGFADEFVADLAAARAPEEPDPEVLVDLLEQYRSSPPREPWRPDDARDAVILQLAHLVFKICLRYRNRNNADDILGEALLALTECVDRWWGVAEDGNIRKYVEFSVRKRIKDFIDNDAVMVVPSRRVREKVAAGEEVDGLARQHLNFAPLDPHRDHDTCSRAPENRHTPTVPFDDTFDCIEFFRKREDERDRVIVEMRIMGRPVEEIAERVGQKKSWIYKRLRNLEQAWACVGESCTTC